MKTILGISSSLMVCLLAVLNAEAEDLFDDWKQNFRAKAFTQGILYSTLDRSLKDIRPDPDVLKLDSSQPEFTKSIWNYIDNATSKGRIKKGQRLLIKHQQILNKVENQYGVPKEIIVAIWAMESDFGANYGSKNIIRSLATLAYQGKRTDFAEQELVSALRIIQNSFARKSELVGSWAGAIGQAQFMPSSYLKYAVDYNADGKRDLWKTRADVFASIANYLLQSGWRSKQGWGVEVSLPIDFDWRLNAAGYELQFLQWQLLGLKQKKQKRKNEVYENTDLPNPYRHASLFIPAGQHGPVFLVTHNFNVIRRYNKSNSYALAVAQLSRLLSNEGVHDGSNKKRGGVNIIASWPRADEPLTHSQKEEIQTLLGKAGYDSGKIDGKIGEITRHAIHNWQIKQGLAGDGYANRALLEQLRKQEELRAKPD